MQWAGRIAHSGEVSNAYRIFVRKSKWKRQCIRPRHIWEKNIRMDLREIGWYRLYSSGCGLGLAVGSYEHVNEPSMNFLTT